MTEDHDMMSNEDRLVYMANQIARNLATMGEERAAKAVADHIARFWEPRMRAKLFAMHDDGSAALSPIADGAIALLRHEGSPPQTRATRFNSVNGVGRSDAG